MAKAIEYTLIASLIAVAAIASMRGTETKKVASPAQLPKAQIVGAKWLDGAQGLVCLELKGPALGVFYDPSKEALVGQHFDLDGKGYIFDARTTLVDDPELCQKGVIMTNFKR